LADLPAAMRIQPYKRTLLGFSLGSEEIRKTAAVQRFGRLECKRILPGYFFAISARTKVSFVA
jgi:hypothetical protein